MVEICTHSTTWMRIVAANGRGMQQHSQLFATNLGAEKTVPASPWPRKHLASYTERGYAQGLVHCWVPGAG